MSNSKKIGIILILVGVCVPIALLGLASQIRPLAGFLINIQQMEIVFRQGYDASTAPAPVPEAQTHFKDDLGLVKKEKKGFTDSLGLLKKEGESTIKPRGGRIISEEEIIFVHKIAIPYRYVFAFGVVLVFAGIGFIILSSNKRDS